MASFWKSAIVSLAAIAAATSAPLAAREEVVVEAGKPWNHVQSGISVPASIEGMARIRVVRFAEDDLDMAVSFSDATTKDLLSVYVYRNTNGSAAVWLSQAQSSLEDGKSLGTPSLAIAPAAFAPTAQSGRTGLQTVYGLTGTDFKSTGIALFSVGDWYVKIRSTSATRTPEQNSAWMRRVISSLHLPTIGPSAPIEPVASCAAPLQAGASSDSMVTQGAGISVPSDRIVAGHWCRDAKLANNQAVYRPVGTNDRYILAMGDNGNAVSVRGEGGYYSQSYITAARTFALPPQDRLPTPQRVLELIAADKAVGIFDTWPLR